MSLKVQWRFIGMESGEQSVGAIGTIMMRQLYVDSLHLGKFQLE